MALDRQASVKNAESLAKEGRVDDAIAEYTQLVVNQPDDWSSGNALGDLHLRSGQRDQAANVFSRVADAQRARGFIPKAIALYKKALKARAADEQALSALADIAEEQELFADARAYLAQLLEHRRRRDDAVGVGVVLERLAALPERRAPGVAPRAPALPPLAVPSVAEMTPDPVIVTHETLSLEPVTVTGVAEPTPTPTPAVSVVVRARSQSEIALAAEATDVASSRKSDESGERDAQLDVSPLTRVDPAPEPAGGEDSVDLAALLEGSDEHQVRVDARTVAVEPPPLAPVAPRPVPPVVRPPVVPSPVVSPPAVQPPVVRPPAVPLPPPVIQATANREPPSEPEGPVVDVLAELEAAAKVPDLQFHASAQLGRLLAARGDLRTAVDWLERAAQTPAPVPEHGTAVLYDLADALERIGETRRALSVLSEIEADAGSYRDVRARIARLLTAHGTDA